MRGSSAFTLLLLLNIFCLVHSTNYYFSFYVTLHCRISNRQFGYNAQFFDKDVAWFNGDDAITDPYINYSLPGDAFFKSEGMLTGDEWLSKFFDLKMVLYHNCNLANEEVRVDMNLLPLLKIPQTLLDNKYYQFELSVDITEMSGEITYTGKLVQNR
ncbi:hypothetical protein CRE_14132 [Caenorhabditis remanei]|uniref:Uncharacterized protein n=1 Tax=Caenorhabditis remanei TaxID=31234 RepID=E3MRE7_CAERE|nr:hypothetical protein CRE_14132 [Caenorhabditis remanei]